MSNLSSSSCCCWQHSCLIAVRNDRGLKNFAMSTTFGMVSGSAIHSFSCSHRSFRFASQFARFLVVGKPNFCHLGAIFSLNSESASASICSLIWSSPLNPSCNSPKPRTISPTRLFTLKHSCRKTNWYGPFSSSLIPFEVSSTAKRISLTSSKISLHSCSAICIGLAVAPSASPPVSFGRRFCSVSNMMLHCVVRNPISAFGCIP
mmetsp:Transcript_16727/g.41402  ORF Transcript_16727/g.41402 Transcript_16727/m.41402 type:complete len:205 (+) Transcript_16727:1651-2265(+)